MSSTDITLTVQPHELMLIIDGLRSSAAQLKTLNHNVAAAVASRLAQSIEISTSEQQSSDS